MMKKIFAMLLALMLCIGALSVAQAQVESIITNVDLPSNNELFAGYVEKQFSGGVMLFSTEGRTAGSLLSGDAKLLYDGLKPQMVGIATGNESSSIVEVTAAFSSSIDGTTIKTTVDALLADMPYEMYWYDKIASTVIEISVLGSEITVKLSMPVAQAYKGAGDYTLNSIPAKVATAVNNAKAVVTANAGKNDFEKLNAYKEYICGAVSYDTDAVTNNAPYGDPWQMISVFDGDPTTNVVCEGYSKAFQYLCDQTNWTGDVQCYTVTGVMSGGTGAGRHMWNIVTLEGKNYLVDVTNSDKGSIGQGGELFLGGTNGSIAGGYAFTIGSSAVSFTYDEEVKEMWGTDDDSILKLESIGYGVDRVASVTLPDGTVTYYADLTSAYDAVKNSTTTDTVLKLLKNVDLQSTWLIDSGCFTIDLNGKTMTCSVDVIKTGYKYGAQRSIIIEDSSSNGTGTVRSSNNNALNIAQATVVIDGGYYYGRANGINMSTSANVTINDGVTIENNNSYYGAINYSSGSLKVNGGKLIGKLGGIYHNNSSGLTIDLSGYHSTEELTIYAQKAVTISNILLPTGYACYNEQGTPYGSDDTTNTKAKIIVKKAATTYTVTFDANGGEGGDREQVFTPNVAQALSANTFTRDNYTFTGWNTAADGTGTAYADNEEITLTANLTLYAQWQAKAATYVVTVTNGTGSGSYAENAAVTIKANTPETGKVFSGWSGANNLTFTSGSPASAEATFTMPAHDVTLEATYADAEASVTAGGTTTYFATLEEAVAHAQNQTGTVKVTVLQPATINEGVYITKGEMTIDLNGKAVSVKASGFHIQGDGTKVIFTDNAVGGSLKASSNDSYVANVVTVGTEYNTDAAEVILEKGAYESGTHTLHVANANAKATIGADSVLTITNPTFGAAVRTAGTLIVTDDNLTGGSDDADIRYEGGTVTLLGNPDGLTLVAYSGFKMPVSNITMPDGYAPYDADNKVVTGETDYTQVVTIKGTSSVYTVTVTPGAGMTKTDTSGAAIQYLNSGNAMTSVVYTADSGYYFPENYTVAESNGITVTRNSVSQITVSGTPIAATTITLPDASAITKLPTPTAAFEATGYDTGILKNVTAGMQYRINNGEWTNIISDADIPMQNVVPCTIYVIHRGDDVTTKDSDERTITVTQATTPALPVTQPTVINGKGSVETTAAHEISTDGTDWTACADGTTELAPGVYYVRVKAAGTELASANQKIEIAAFNPTQEMKPAAIFTANGHTTGTLTNVKAGMQYKIGEDGVWTNIDSDEPVALDQLAPCTIYVKQSGTSTTMESEVQEISVTRAAAPALTATQPSVIDGKGSIPTTSVHEISTDGANWADCTGTSNDLEPGTYYVRVRADGAVLASDYQEITINAFNPAQAPTPQAVFTATGYNCGTLTNVSEGMQYSLDRGFDWIDIESTSVELPNGVYPSNDIRVRMPATQTALASEVQMIDVTRADKPELQVTQPAAIGEYGKIATTAIHEYSTNGLNWKDCNGEMTGLASANYYIRVKAQGTVLASDHQSVSIMSFYPDREETPQAGFVATGYDTGTLTNVEAGLRYSLDMGTTWIDITGSSVELTGVSWIRDVEVIRPGNGTTTEASFPQKIDVLQAERPALTPTQPDKIGGTGSIPTTTVHEYSTDGTTWTACTGPMIDLAPGTYYVRVKAEGMTLASAAQEIRITAFNPAREAKPNAVFTATGYDTGLLSGVENGMAYKIGQGGWIDITSSNQINLSDVDHGFISVIKKGNGTTTEDSIEERILVTRATIPYLIATQPSTVGGTGSIPTTTAHEFSTDGTTWTACTGEMTGLAPGSYHVRVKAAGAVLASDMQTIVIHSVSAQNYTVTFDANGGTGTMADVIGVLGSYTLPACGFAAPDGMQFKAWEISGREYAPGATIRVTSNLTVKALWEAIPPVISDPVIISPTTDQTVTVIEGERAILTITAQNAAKYQWYIDYNDGAGWKPCGDGTATYVSAPTKLSNNGYRYYCEVTSATGETAKSPIFTLVVVAPVALPETGDNSQIGLWAAMLALCGAGMLTLRSRKRRTE